MYKLLKQEGRARRGEFVTNRGTVQTPAFMNVATAAAIKGAVSAKDLETLGCQIMLSNTYHLHVRPGDEVIRGCGGLHKFTTWNGPIMGPEESMTIQSNLGSTIAMAFDECVENPAEYSYSKASCERTTRWLVRCKEKMADLNSRPDTINKEQLLFGINQGCTYRDLRVEHMKRIAELDLDGYAIGGLAVGEPTDVMYDIIENVTPHMPENKIRYLMGVGTPANILNAVERGVDLFDCVMPSRNARHGHLFTSKGIINLNNKKYEYDMSPIDENCGCPVCKNYSRAYIRHLLKSQEMLSQRLTVMHNLWFYNHLMEDIRNALDNGNFTEFKREKEEILSQRI